MVRPDPAGGLVRRRRLEPGVPQPAEPERRRPRCRGPEHRPPLRARRCRPRCRRPRRRDRPGLRDPAGDAGQPGARALALDPLRRLRRERLGPAVHPPRQATGAAGPLRRARRRRRPRQHADPARAAARAGAGAAGRGRRHPPRPGPALREQHPARQAAAGHDRHAQGGLARGAGEPVARRRRQGRLDPAAHRLGRARPVPVLAAAPLPGARPRRRDRGGAGRPSGQPPHAAAAPGDPRRQPPARARGCPPARRTAGPRRRDRPRRRRPAALAADPGPDAGRGHLVERPGAVAGARQ